MAKSKFLVSTSSGLMREVSIAQAAGRAESAHGGKFTHAIWYELASLVLLELQGRLPENAQDLVDPRTWYRFRHMLDG